jgi:NAD(P)H-hydrate epimerase
MARLAGVSPAEVQAHRLDTARGIAKKLRAIVVLKGAHSLIAAPDGVVYVNPTGNAGMATAGSGDVLSGVTGALLAEGVHPYAAAVCGAFLHGMAGDAAAAAAGQRSVTAGDMARAVVDVARHFDS